MIKVEINFTRLNNQEQLTISTHFDYNDCPLEMFTPFIEELYAKPAVQQELQRRGFSTIKTMLPEYLKCLYGGHDNSLDLNGATTTSDYCHCGKRGTCPSEGFPGLCSLASVEGRNITPVELQLVSGLANDQIYKELASSRSRSYNTVNTQLRKVRVKCHTLRTPNLICKFMKAGLISNIL